MKKENGITLVALTITIIVMLIIASITTYYGTDLIKEAKLQDLRTNMLLIQAEAKKGLEEVCFQTANLDPTKTEDAQKISQIKTEANKKTESGEQVLKGIPINDSGASEAKSALPSGVSADENCYYLDEATLNDMGLKDLNADEYGYFIVRYDFSNISVEVINTKGYKGNYTLTQINELTEE